MLSNATTTNNMESTRAFERARKRVRFALDMAENGLLDLDTMDDICRTLTLALMDLEEVNSAAVSELRAA
jgi:ATP:corrinoid adenosyltransferase